MPGLNEENPPEKDTVIVPRGGYVVVRYFASNAGKYKKAPALKSNIVK